MRKTRLFISLKPLQIGVLAKIDGQDFEYLTKVMRKKIGDEIFIFNGVDGEFLAEILTIEKRNLTISITKKTADQTPQGLVTLAFAPVKNVRIDFIASKATEMGVAKFLPIITKHCVVDKINEERFKANIKEACEQCERNDIAQILPIIKLEKLINNIETIRKTNSKETILILCDEENKDLKASEILQKIFTKQKELQQEIIIFVGPEGGFSKEEFASLRQIKNLYSIGLGKNILRSDTAIIAALALINEYC